MFVAEAAVVSRHPIDKESVECIADCTACSCWSSKPDILEKVVFQEEWPKYSSILLHVDTSELDLTADAYSSLDVLMEAVVSKKSKSWEGRYCCYLRHVA